MASAAAHPQTDEATSVLLSKLHAASASWSKFDLDQRRSALAAATSATREGREQSAAARKTLAASTKSLKKSVAAATAASSGSTTNDDAAATKTAVADLAKIVRSTVKSYQEEIDALTRRCKSSDGAVSDLLAGLKGVDDPGPLLAAGATNLDALAIALSYTLIIVMANALGVVVALTLHLCGLAAVGAPPVVQSNSMGEPDRMASFMGVASPPPPPKGLWLAACASQVMLTT